MRFRGVLQLHGSSVEGESLKRGIAAVPAKRDGIELMKGTLRVVYPKGGIVFLEGQLATGIFLLRVGRAKESVVSNQGKTVIVRVVGPDAILGLSAVLTGAPHESTIEALEPTHADFIRKAAFLQLLKSSRHLSQIVASQLSCNCKEAYAAIRCLGVSGSVSERLARLLLQWTECPLANQNREMEGIRIRVSLTHEAISQLIGSSRETTSRLLVAFRKKQWIVMNGSIWTIINEDALRRLAAA